jgi:hypothetical protein
MFLIALSSMNIYETASRYDIIEIINGNNKIMLHFEYESRTRMDHIDYTGHSIQY